MIEFDVTLDENIEYGDIKAKIDDKENAIEFYSDCVIHGMVQWREHPSWFKFFRKPTINMGEFEISVNLHTANGVTPTSKVIYEGSVQNSIESAKISIFEVNNEIYRRLNTYGRFFSNKLEMKGREAYKTPERREENKIMNTNTAREVFNNIVQKTTNKYIEMFDSVFTDIVKHTNEDLRDEIEQLRKRILNRTIDKILQEQYTTDEKRLEEVINSMEFKIKVLEEKEIKDILEKTMKLVYTNEKMKELIELNLEVVGKFKSQSIEEINLSNAKKIFNDLTIKTMKIYEESVKVAFDDVLRGINDDEKYSEIILSRTKIENSVYEYVRTKQYKSDELVFNNIIQDKSLDEKEIKDMLEKILKPLYNLDTIKILVENKVESYLS